MFIALAHAYWLTAPQIERLMAAHGITRGIFDVLTILRRAGKPHTLSPRQIARSLLLSGAGLTSRLDRLEADELIVRRPDAHDGRGLKVSLTPKGLQLVDRILPEADPAGNRTCVRFEQNADSAAYGPAGSAVGVGSRLHLEFRNQDNPEWQGVTFAIDLPSLRCRLFGMTIDTHAHSLDEAFLRDLCSAPRFGLSAERDRAGRYCVRRGEGPAVSLDHDLIDIPRRIESLRQRNVSLQLVGPPPGFVSWPGGAADVEYARALNAHGARVVAQSERLLELMVALPLGEPEQCASELERALDLYGARSALLPATAGGKPLDTGEFDAMFEVAERRGILLFLHPVSPEPPWRFPIYTLQLVVQWPAETSFAIARMIFGGFFDRFPRLNMLLAHGGGTTLFLKGRLNSAYEARGAEGDPYFTAKISRPPGEYLDRLYYDTCSLSPESVEFTIKVAGVHRVMFGTDFPFEIGDAEGKRALPAIEALPADARSKILRDNVASVLNAVRR